MSKVFALYHIVFSTKNREPVLRNIDRAKFHTTIVSIAEEYRGPVFVVNSVDDHVHMLLRLSSETALSSLMASLKARANYWLKDNCPQFKAWGQGYYASTISPSAIGQVTNYINAQPEHHRKYPFVDELKAMGELWSLGYHPNDLL